MNKRQLIKKLKFIFDMTIATITFYSFITLIINLFEHNVIYINNYIVSVICIIHYNAKAIYNSNKRGKRLCH